MSDFVAIELKDLPTSIRVVYQDYCNYYSAAIDTGHMGLSTLHKIDIKEGRIVRANFGNFFSFDPIRVYNDCVEIDNQIHRHHHDRIVPTEHRMLRFYLKNHEIARIEDGKLQDSSKLLIETDFTTDLGLDVEAIIAGFEKNQNPWLPRISHLVKDPSLYKLATRTVTWQKFLGLFEKPQTSRFLYAREGSLQTRIDINGITPTHNTRNLLL